MAKRPTDAEVAKERLVVAAVTKEGAHTHWAGMRTKTQRYRQLSDVNLFRTVPEDQLPSIDEVLEARAGIRQAESDLAASELAALRADREYDAALTAWRVAEHAAAAPTLEALAQQAVAAAEAACLAHERLDQFEQALFSRTNEGIIDRISCGSFAPLGPVREWLELYRQRTAAA